MAVEDDSLMSLGNLFHSSAQPDKKTWSRQIEKACAHREGIYQRRNADLLCQVYKKTLDQKDNLEQDPGSIYRHKEAAWKEKSIGKSTDLKSCEFMNFSVPRLPQTHQNLVPSEAISPSHKITKYLQACILTLLVGKCHRSVH